MTFLKMYDTRTVRLVYINARRRQQQMKPEASSPLYRELMNQLGDFGPTWTQYLCVLYMEFKLSPKPLDIYHHAMACPNTQHTMNKQLHACRKWNQVPPLHIYINMLHVTHLCFKFINRNKWFWELFTFHINKLTFYV